MRVTFLIPQLIYLNSFYLHHLHLNIILIIFEEHQFQKRFDLFQNKPFQAHFLNLGLSLLIVIS